MKFRIISVANYYVEEMIKEYPELKEYGYDDSYPVKSQYYQDATVIISSLEELLQLYEKLRQPLIISECTGDIADYEIEIYDGYRE